MTYTSDFIGQAEKTFESYQQNKTTGNSEMGQDQFLQLLVAQLQYQDPLNPMEDKEFTAQLAQFSSLEQLTNINSGIESLTEGTERQEMLSAVSFIGKEVRAEGQTVSKMDGKISDVYFTLDESASNVYVNIFDSAGSIVKTVNYGALQAGTFSMSWDGTDYNDTDVADGVYYIAMAAEDSSGEPILLDTQVTGEVKGVQVDGNSFLLELADGRTVNMLDIKEVVNATPTEAEETDES